MNVMVKNIILLWSICFIIGISDAPITPIKNTYTMLTPTLLTQSTWQVKTRSALLWLKKHLIDPEPELTDATTPSKLMGLLSRDELIFLLDAYNELERVKIHRIATESTQMILGRYRKTVEHYRRQGYHIPSASTYLNDSIFFLLTKEDIQKIKKFVYPPTKQIPLHQPSDTEVLIEFFKAYQQPAQELLSTLKQLTQAI